MNRFKIGTIVMCAVPIVLAVFVFLLIPNHKKGPAYRTDQIGLNAVITIPTSWTKQYVSGGWVYRTGCTLLGLKAIESQLNPEKTLEYIEPQQDHEYAPIVGRNFAWVPGTEVIQVLNGIDVMVLIGKGGCPGVAHAIDSIKYL